MPKIDPFQMAVQKELKRLKVAFTARKLFREWREEESRPKPEPEVPDRAATPSWASPIAKQIIEGKAEVKLAPEKYDAWKATIAKRADLQLACQTSIPGTWAGEGDFIRSEANRKSAARRHLLNAVNPADVAVACGLSLEEVAEIRKELNL